MGPVIMFEGNLKTVETDICFLIEMILKTLLRHYHSLTVHSV